MAVVKCETHRCKSTDSRHFRMMAPVLCIVGHAALLCVLSFLGQGCSNQPKKITIIPVPPPVFPKLVKMGNTWNVPRIKSDKQSKRYLPDEGTPNPTTKDNVSIEVIPIEGGSTIQAETMSSLFVVCSGANDEKFSVSTTGLGIYLRVQNKTGHILRTKLSVLQVEDSKGKEIAIRTSVSDWKKRARRIIEAKYTDQEKLLARATKERVIAIQKFYAPIVDSYKYDWEDYLAKITKKNNEAKKEHGLNIALESFLSPNRAYSPASIEKEILSRMLKSAI